MIVIDAHLDLAWNALGWNRDLTATVREIRQSEEHRKEEKARARNTVSFPAMREGKVVVSLATVLARAGGLRDDRLDYRTQEIAYAAAQGQLAYYRVMESEGQMRMIRDWASFENHLDQWKNSGDKPAPLGFILAMEGADPIVSPAQLTDWWNDGLRVIGLAHYGLGIYAHGTGSSGGLTPRGVELLKTMDDVGMVLDATHLADESFWQAVEQFKGPVLASHNNCRALVPADRQFSDEQIRYLIGRDSVIGAAFDDWMLYPGWVRGKTSSSLVTLDAVVDHIDRVCQLAGNTRHSAIGSDLDGGFGTEQSPSDLDTIADLQKIPGLLRKRGYKDSDVEAIMHGNWIRFFKAAWNRH